MSINVKYLRILTYHLIACELRASRYRYEFMNTDMNQYLIFRKCMGKTARALKFFQGTVRLGLTFVHI